MITGSDPIRVLFLCTGNSCRSQMGEALLRHLGGGRFAAFSAGSRPAGFVHPLALEALRVLSVPADNLESKSWNMFAGEPFDAVITLCDAAAAEQCPTFAGAGIRAHWSLPDPAFLLGGDDERIAFAIVVAQRLQAKIEAMMALDWAMPPAKVQKRLQFLGEI